MAEDRNMLANVGNPLDASTTASALNQQVQLASRPAAFVPGSDYTQVSKTPSHMLLMDDLLGSTVENFTDHAVLYDYTFSHLKLTNPDQGGPLYSSAQVTASDVEVIIPHGAHMTTLFDKMHRGEKFDMITIVALANIAETNVHMLDLNFMNNYIQKITPNKEKIIITFKYAAHSVTAYEYGQDGQLLGQTEYAKDLTTGASQ